jgi:hypothetical protein
MERKFGADHPQSAGLVGHPIVAANISLFANIICSSN